MKSEMDNNEWADEEMSLERFSRKNLFTVPSGYFEEAGQRILSLVKLDELKSTDTANGFEVPANYFDELSANISSRINIKMVTDAEQPGFAVPENYFDQLTANITSRINIETEREMTDFAVPEGYFDNLTANIQSRIAIEEAASAGDAGFNVPAGYFDNLQQQISARIEVEEALEAAPAAFAVPEGYFEELNRNILNKTVNKDAVVRKTIVRKLFATNTFKYATAACLALIVGAGVFLRDAGNTAVQPHKKTLLHTQLSTIPVDEIKDYLELHVDATDNHGIMDDDKGINTQALDEDLSDYVDIN
jgi:hypothetical protein